jgi:carboxylesterase type B
VQPWCGYLNASIEGPVCPYHSVYFGPLMRPNGICEACIFANIHVPLTASDYPQGLPIIVFIHGGALYDGSGDSDVYGPERLVDKDVIVITFNYRYLPAFQILTSTHSYVLHK